MHDKAAQAWLLTVSSAEGQKALSLEKGSIPARTDTVAEDYPPYQQAAIASLQLDTVVPSLAHGVAANPAWTKAITTAVVKFGGDGHPEALANALIAAAHSAARRRAGRRPQPLPPPAWHPEGVYRPAIM